MYYRRRRYNYDAGRESRIGFKSNTKNEMKKFLLLELFYQLLPVDTFPSKKLLQSINIDYGYTPIPNFSEWGRHRATADPVIVNYKGDYYLFSYQPMGLLVEQ